jgi:type II secretory pathway pseudopilin PulG
MNSRPSAFGFTIVELLVVVAIMAMLFALILAGGRSGTASEVRRAARQIAGVLLSAQSRAIGSRTGAAVLLESDGDPTLLASNNASSDPKNNRAVRLRDADMAPAITAEVISPFQIPPIPPDVVQSPPFRPDARVVAIPKASNPPTSQPVVPENASSTELDGGFRIRFMRPGSQWSVWYGFLPRGEDRNTNGTLDPGEDLQWDPSEPPDGQLDSSPAAYLRFKAGQTWENSVWPASIPSLAGPPAVPPTYRVEISRYPGIGSPALNLSKLVAIDLRYSGHGDDAATTSPWGRLASKGVVGVAYDTVGSVELLMQNVTGYGGSRANQPLSPTQPIYLFVVSREELEADLADQSSPSTLASEQAFWVAIEPQTGRVHVAANEPQRLPTGEEIPTVEQLRAARRLARNATTLPK